MLPSEEEAARFAVVLVPPPRGAADDAHARWARDVYDRLPSRARAALRGLWAHRAAHGLRHVGPRERAVLRALRHGDPEEVLAAVRAAILHPLAPAA